jgi:hypothetical protein
MTTTALHPSNRFKVVFDEVRHTYDVFLTNPQPHDEPERCESGTSFISRFFPKFDTDAVAARCVGKPKYAGLSADEIKAAWRAKANAATKRGTRVHLFAERLMTGEGTLPAPADEREAALFLQTSRAVVALLKRFAFVAAEQIVFAPSLLLAGTIDLVMFDPKKRAIVLFDWKQNETIDIDNKWESGLPPIEHLPASSFVKYSLQLNLYQRIYSGEEFGPKSVEYRRALIHLMPDRYVFYKVPDLQKEIQAMVALP